MLAFKVGLTHSVKVEYDVREDMTEVHGVKFSHSRESGHTDKWGRIVCLQEAYPSVNIG